MVEEWSAWNKTMLAEVQDSFTDGFEGEACLAAPGKEFPDIASVDKSDVNVGTIRGAPSDRVLTRKIKNAKVIRIPLSPTNSADAAAQRA